MKTNNFRLKGVSNPKQKILLQAYRPDDERLRKTREMQDGEFERKQLVHQKHKEFIKEEKDINTQKKTNLETKSKITGSPSN